jgi:hypothetical protein
MARSLSHSLIALLALPLAAQTIDHSYPRVSIFYGTAPAIGDSGLQKVRESVLIGLEYSHPIWKGQVSAAVEWRSFRSRNHEVTRFSPRKADGTTLLDGDPGAVKTGYAKDGQTGYITAFTRYPGASPYTGIENAIASDMRFDSIHMAKYDVDGGTSKIAYRQFFKLPFIGDLGVHAGLTINFLTGAEYTTGDIHVLAYRQYSGQNNLTSSITSDDPRLDAYGRLFNEPFYKDNTDMKILPGAFAGARAFVNDNFFFETNIVMVSYSQPVYMPYAYTGKDPYVESSTKSKVVWEFNAGFRF